MAVIGGSEFGVGMRQLQRIFSLATPLMVTDCISLLFACYQLRACVVKSKILDFKNLNKLVQITVYLVRKTSQFVQY